MKNGNNTFCLSSLLCALIALVATMGLTLCMACNGSKSQEISISVEFSVNQTFAYDTATTSLGYYSGRQHNAITLGVLGNGNNVVETLPSTTKWTFETKINGHVKPLEFKFVEYTGIGFYWKFVPVETGLYEITATASYNGKSGTSRAVVFTVTPIPPRSSQPKSSINLFHDGVQVFGNEINATRGSTPTWDTPSLPTAEGIKYLEWIMESATGSFLDGGSIRFLEIFRNNNLMSLNSGTLAPGTYHLSIPCIQQETDGTIRTVNHEFTVNVK